MRFVLTTGLLSLTSTLALGQADKPSDSLSMSLDKPEATLSCIKPLQDVGQAFADTASGLMIVSRWSGPNTHRTLVFGVAHRGAFFGCSLPEKTLSLAVARKSGGTADKASATTRNHALLRFQNAGANGVDVTLSSTHRILFARVLSVPWDLVDKSDAVVATCSKSLEARFATILNSELNAQKARSCSLVEVHQVTK